MRKRIGLVLWLGCTVTLLHAQPSQVEVYAGLGFLSAPDLLDLHGDAFDAAGDVPAEERTTGTTQFLGPFMAGLNYFVRPNWTVGVAGVYNTYDKEVRRREGGQPMGEYTDKYLTLLVRIKYRYYWRNVVQLYSGVAAGPSFYSQRGMLGTEAREDDRTYLAYQVNAFGLRIGRTFAGFLELGFGYTGLLSIGVSYQPR